MDEKRLREIEGKVFKYWRGGLPPWDVLPDGVAGELIAEVRSLRKEAQDGYEWAAKATLWEDERDKARRMVDRLLEDWPWRRTTQGKICPACQSFENYCDCSRKQVSDARDWEVRDE